MVSNESIVLCVSVAVLYNLFGRGSLRSSGVFIVTYTYIFVNIPLMVALYIFYVFGGEWGRLTFWPFQGYSWTFLRTYIFHHHNRDFCTTPVGAELVY